MTTDQKVVAGLFGALAIAGVVVLLRSPEQATETITLTEEQTKWWFTRDDPAIPTYGETKVFEAARDKKTIIIRSHTGERLAELKDGRLIFERQAPPP